MDKNEIESFKCVAFIKITKMIINPVSVVNSDQRQTECRRHKLLKQFSSKFAKLTGSKQSLLPILV